MSIGECFSTDECDLGTHNCSDNAMCVNTDAGYNCTCNTYFEGDGFTCTHQCDLNVCLNGATCSRDTNTNKPICDCRQDYSGDCCQSWTEPNRGEAELIIGWTIGAVVGVIA